MRATQGLAVIGLGLALAAGCSFRAEGSAKVGSGAGGSERTQGGESTDAPDKGKTVAMQPTDPNAPDTKHTPKKDKEPAAGDGNATNPGNGAANGADKGDKAGHGDKADKGEDDNDREPVKVTEVDDKPQPGENRAPKKLPRSISIGAPTNLAPQKATAVWVWYDEATALWQVRTTSGSGRHVFRGRVGVSGPKSSIKEAKSLKASGGDSYLIRPQAVHFAVATNRGTDGIDVKAEGGKCVYFRFLMDEKPAPEVYIGKDNTLVGSARFRVCDDDKKTTDKVSSGSGRL